MLWNIQGFQICFSALILYLCEVAECLAFECTLCLHGGQCMNDTKDGARCWCTDGYGGDHCQYGETIIKLTNQSFNKRTTKACGV